MKSFSEVINEGYLWNGEELHGNFRIDLGIFEQLSRDVGYLNAKANQKWGDDDEYDENTHKEYDKYRGLQLDMFQKMMELYEDKLK